MLSPKVRHHLEQALLEALRNHMAGKRKKKAVSGRKKTARRPAKKKKRAGKPVKRRAAIKSRR